MQLKPTQASTLREEQPTHGVIQSFTWMQSISDFSLKTRGNSALSCLKNAKKKISVINIPYFHIVFYFYHNFGALKILQSIIFNLAEHNQLQIKPYHVLTYPYKHLRSPWPNAQHKTFQQYS